MRPHIRDGREGCIAKAGMGEDKGCINGLVISGTNEDRCDVDGAGQNARLRVSHAVQDRPGWATGVCVVR